MVIWTVIRPMTQLVLRSVFVGTHTGEEAVLPSCVRRTEEMTGWKPVLWGKRPVEP